MPLFRCPDVGHMSQHHIRSPLIGFQSIPVQVVLATHADWHTDTVDADEYPVPPRTFVLTYTVLQMYVHAVSANTSLHLSPTANLLNEIIVHIVCLLEKTLRDFYMYKNVENW